MNNYPYLEWVSTQDFVCQVQVIQLAGKKFHGKQHERDNQPRWLITKCVNAAQSIPRNPKGVKYNSHFLFCWLVKCAYFETESIGHVYLNIPYRFTVIYKSYYGSHYYRDGNHVYCNIPYKYLVFGFLSFTYKSSRWNLAYYM
jgi:hypothetical protein